MNLFNVVSRAFRGTKPSELDTRRVKMAIDTANYRVTDDYSSAKMEMQAAGPKSIARARDLVTNSPLPRAFYNCLCKYVVGDSGFSLRARVALADGGLDLGLNKQIEKAWADFLKPQNISTSGNKSGLDLNLGMVYSLVVSGDAFVRVVEGSRWKYGMALQVLSPERIESPAIYSNDTWNGIRLNEWDAPISYWYRQGENPLGYQFDYKEIPAAQVIHAWLQLRPDSNRGLTPLAPVAINQYDLDAVRESTRTNLRHFANLLAFFVGAKDDNPFEPDSSGGVGAPDHEAVMQSFALRMGKHFQSNPGTFGIAPPGDLKQLDPKHPISNYSDFVKTENRQMCPAYGITPCLLMAELDGTSYSASKAASQYDADFFKLWQTMFIQKIWGPVYERWLRIQFATGRFGFTCTDEDEFQAKYLQFTFAGRPFPMADKYKDAKAQEIMLANRLATRTSILAADGIDFEDLAKEAAGEDAVLARLGQAPLHTSVVADPPEAPEPVI